MTELSHLVMHDVLMHYRRRIATSKQLRKLLKANNVAEYVPLALGIENPEGNYSASDHKLGERVLSQTPPEIVFELAEALNIVTSAKEMLDSVYSAAIPFIKVSVGSEMAMLLQPECHWVANTRTVWAHLLVKHGWDYDVANEALTLYRDADRDSLMNYQIWRAIHKEMHGNMLKLAKLGTAEAENQEVEAGELQYIWADAVANALYEYED